MPQQCLSSPALLLCCCTGAPCMRTLQPNRFHGCPQMPEQLANYVLPAKRAELLAACIASAEMWSQQDMISVVISNSGRQLTREALSATPALTRQERAWANAAHCLAHLVPKERGLLLPGPR